MRIRWKSGARWRYGRGLPDETSSQNTPTAADSRGEEEDSASTSLGRNTVAESGLRRITGREVATARQRT